MTEVTRTIARSLRQWGDAKALPGGQAEPLKVALDRVTVQCDAPAELRGSCAAQGGRHFAGSVKLCTIRMRSLAPLEKAGLRDDRPTCF